MSISLRNCKVLLVLAYVAVNVVTYAKTIEAGVLQDELAGYPAPAPTVSLLLLLGIALSYALIQFPVFDAFRRFGKFARPRGEAIEVSVAVHVSMMLLTLAQLAFALTTGAGIAGSSAQSANPLRFFIYAIPIDMLGIIYLAAARDQRLYKINLVIYLVSSLARGWSSGIIFLLWIALIRENGFRFRLRNTLIGLSLFVVVAPALLLLRFAVRASEADLADLQTGLDLILDGQNLYLYILSFLSDRLQHFTFVAYIYESRDAIAIGMNMDQIRPFYLNGPWPYTVAGSLGSVLPPELNHWLTAQAFGLDADASGYAAHVGMIGWPIAAPSLLLIYIAYIGGLGLISVMVSRAIGIRAVVELTWLIWLLFLMNGWYGAFVAYVLGLFMARLVQLAPKFIRPRRRPRPSMAAA